MQFWSQQHPAFVDLVDGYAHLPFFDDWLIEKRVDAIGPEQLSILLHELTHQLALQGAMSWCLAHHTAIHAAAMVIGKAEYEGLDEGGVARDAERYKHLWMEDFYNNNIHLADSIYLFSAVVYGLRWLFEGLATYAQLRLRPGGMSSPGRHIRFTSTFFNTFSETVRISQDEVQKRIEEARTSPSTRSLRRLMLKNPSEDPCPYAIGFLIISRLQSILIAKDPRLVHPECFFEFANRYFMDDAKLIHLSRPKDGDGWRSYAAVRTHIVEAVNDLLGADTDRLRDAVSALCESPEPASRNLDLRESLRTGRLSWLDERKVFDALETIRREFITERVKESLGPNGRTRNSHRAGEEVAREATELSGSVFRAMRLGHNLFRIRQSDPILIGCSVRGDPVHGLGHVLLGYPQIAAYVASHMTPQQVAFLKHDATTTGHWTADLDMPESAVASLSERTLDIKRAASLLKRAEDERYLRLKEIDAYDVRADERLCIYGGAAAVLIRNGRTQGGVGPPAANGIAYERLGAWNWRAAYWEAIQIFVFENFNPLGPPIHEVDAILVEVWRKVFPASCAPDSELQTFFRQKLNVLGLSRETEELACHCLSGSFIEVDAHWNVLDRVNRYWSWYTGDVLFLRTTSESSVSCVLFPEE